MERVFLGKAVMPLGVSTGMLGTIRAQLHLREILSAPGVQAKILSPGGNEVLVNFAAQKFDENTGKLVDDTTLSFLDDKVEKFIELIMSGR
ncbi:NAD(P)H-dependent FMN reductase [Lederbergia wuyishanensis]|uniref:NAD(P)H-dependent FMN reductase n=1 Tax=Lederbergia wuyishanensis TaxID=1347903 RepID=A0ABU0D8W9_9BACI|nr:NAD(P)H-dependent FMN reductase [Lederbergia wuyishanensis]